MKRFNLHIQEIFKTIDGIDIRRLSDELERYLNISKSTDEQVHCHSPLSENIGKTYRLCYDSLEKEISVLLSRIAISLNHFMNFRFSAHGNLKHDPKELAYFKQLKSQQIGLLMSISDETEMLQNLMRQAAKMRRLLAKNSEPFQRYAYLTKVLLERLEERPTTLLRLHGKDEKIKELNQTMQDMNEYENWYNADMQKWNGEKIGFTPYLDIIRESQEKIRQYRKNIASDITEFRQGWEFFRKLAFHGILPKIRKPLDELIEKDRLRKAAFRDYICRCRQTSLNHNG